MNFKNIIQKPLRFHHQDIHEELDDIKNELQSLKDSVQGLRECIGRLSETKVLRMSEHSDDCEGKD